jgi:hypothetical protein
MAPLSSTPVPSRSTSSNLQHVANLSAVLLCTGSTLSIEMAGLVSGVVYEKLTHMFLSVCGFTSDCYYGWFVGRWHPELRKKCVQNS